MAQPAQSDVHIDQALTNVSIAHIQDDRDFIARQVFPIIPVPNQSGKVYTYTQSDWARDEAEPRADATESAGSGYGVSTTSYDCTVYALHKDIGSQVRANADSQFNLDAEAARFVTHLLLLRMEKQWASDFFTTSVWDTDSTPSNTWDDYAASDPVTDIETGVQTVLQNTGFRPNTFVMGYQVWRQLKHHPDFVDRVKYTSAESVTEQTIARYLNFDRVLVASAVNDTANEGATDSFAFVHGKHALLAYVPSRPSLLTPSAGYTFAWEGIGSRMGLATSRFEIPEKKSTRVESEAAWDNVVTSSALGYFFNGAVA